VDKKKAKGNCPEMLEEDTNQIQKAYWYGVLKRAGFYGLLEKEVLETVKDSSVKYCNVGFLLQGRGTYQSGRKVQFNSLNYSTAVY